MAEAFSADEWRRVHLLMDRDGEKFGLPVRRDDSVILGSFNIRKLAAVKNKSPGTWDMLAKICRRFDLIAIQEVQDTLEGLVHLKKALGDEYGMTASDITGGFPGDGSPVERLAFLFRWDKVQRTEVASDITYDRSVVVDTLYGARHDFWNAFDDFTQKLANWVADTTRRRGEGKKPKTKPVIRLPKFLTFIRQPLCVSFRIPGQGDADPFEFLAVNAHLLYGRYKSERRMEFWALMNWLISRARQAKRMYHPNILLLGDLNFDFVRAAKRRRDVEAKLKELNKGELSGKNAATIYFPFFDVHPKGSQVFRTNARLSQTYDQIVLVAHDPRLPTPVQRRSAGAVPGQFDYGVFNFVDLFAQALHHKPFGDLAKPTRNALLKKFEHDFSDHMPLWIRLPAPSGKNTRS